MKKLFLALVLVLTAVSASAQTATLVYAKDVGDASYTYCRYVGINGDPFAGPILGPGTIKTTGSSTTVDEAVASTNPFAEVAVGDMLVVQVGSTVYRRRVTARASAAQITVDSAITLTGNAWTWYRQQCGTAATDGWIRVSGAEALNFVVDYSVKNATSLDYSFECRVADSISYFDTTGRVSMSAAGVQMLVVTAVAYDACRIGLKITGDTGVNTVASYIHKR